MHEHRNQRPTISVTTTFDRTPSYITVPFHPSTNLITNILRTLQYLSICRVLQQHQETELKWRKFVWYQRPCMSWNAWRRLKSKSLCITSWRPKESVSPKLRDCCHKIPRHFFKSPFLFWTFPKVFPKYKSLSFLNKVMIFVEQLKMETIQALFLPNTAGNNPKKIKHL